MASVKVIKGLTYDKAHQTVIVGGLGYPAKDYTSFRFKVTVDGVAKYTRSFTFYSTANSFEWYDNTNITSGTEIFAELWATKGGVEYYIGKSNVARPFMTAGKYINKVGETLPATLTDFFHYTMGANNLSKPFNTNAYKQMTFNLYGCIEDSSVTPRDNLVVIYAKAPQANDTVNFRTTVASKNLIAPGQQIFANVQSTNGRWYNLGFRIAPSTATTLNP